MNLYGVLAVFILSCSVILACLDRLKMRVAIGLFYVLCAVLVVYIPIAIFGVDIAQFCYEHQHDTIFQSVIAFANRTVKLSGLAFTSVTFILVILAIFCIVSSIILAVQTAKAICKIVQAIKKKRQHPKHPAKKTFEPKLVHSKILYKRILYLRLCRLNS